MKNILVMAYAISPNKGSEFSVAWNYVSEMSKNNKLVVLYGVTGKHIGEIETEMFLPNVEFVPIYSSKKVEYLNYLNKRNLFKYSFYLAYKEWHKLAYERAKALIAIDKFDLIHFVGMIGYREPGYLWNIDLPYIWGPIGGVNNLPELLIKTLPMKYRLMFRFRNIINNYQLKYNRRVKKALKNTDLLLTATSENRDKILSVHKKESYCLPENSITGEIHLNDNKFVNIQKCHLLVIGDINPGKGINLLLDSLLLIKDRARIQLDIVGDGPSKPYLMEFVKDNGLEDIVNWHGFLPRSQAVQLFQNTHLHVITSLSEGNPTVVWEAMSNGVPTLTLDHCGMHDVICEKCGIKISIVSNDQVKNDIAAAISSLLDNPSRLRELAYGVLECATMNSWANRTAILERYYDQAIMNYTKKQKDNNSHIQKIL